jgi:hypothetical protein
VIKNNIQLGISSLFNHERAEGDLTDEEERQKEEALLV